MSNKNKSTKQKTTTTTAKARRSVSRPEKTAAPKRAEKARSVTVTTDDKQPTNLAGTGPLVANVPRSVRKLADAKAKPVLPKRPLGRPVKTPAVNTDHLKKALEEATAATKHYQAEATKYREERDVARRRAITANTAHLAAIKEIRKNERTIERLQALIDEFKAKEVKRSWLRRLFRGKA